MKFLLKNNNFFPEHSTSRFSKQPSQSQTVITYKTNQSKVENLSKKGCLAKAFSTLDMESETNENSELSEKEESVSDETIQMIALGLPMTFGKSADQYSENAAKKSEQ